MANWAVAITKLGTASSTLNRMTCTVLECDSPTHAKGYCQVHYLRVKQYGRTDLLPRPGFSDRFWARVIREDGCWRWMGSVNSTGYGHFTWREDGKIKTRGAHVIAYELHTGTTVSGTIDHLCRNPGCVNPAHLEPVSMRENTLRGDSPVAGNARKTHCKRDHPLAGHNLIIKRGKYGQQRICRICRNTEARERMRRARG